jgi:hypothetical protein
MSGKLACTLQEVKTVVKKHLLLDDYTIVDIILAVVIANLFKTDPLWMLILGASSTAKTELLAALDGLPMMFFVSDLTANTLVSGKKDASLLPRLDKKIIVMKDFTTILSKRPDDLKIIMGHLREVYDGKLIKSYGTGDTVNWTGHVGFLGASTPVFDRKHGVISQMGERFLLFRNTNRDDIKSGIQALAGFGSESKMRSELKEVFTKFLNQFKKVSLTIPELPENMQYQIVSLATLCGHARCHVHRDPYAKDEITYLPEPEGSPRLTKQLFHLAIALMAINGVDEITKAIYSVLLKVGTDLIPRIRFNIIKYLWDSMAVEGTANFLTTTEVATGTGIHGKTSLRALQDMSIIGLTKGTLEETTKGTPYIWQLSKKTILLIEGSEVFEKEQAFETRLSGII